MGSGGLNPPFLTVNATEWGHIVFYPALETPFPQVCIDAWEKPQNQSEAYKYSNNLLMSHHPLYKHS